MVTSSLRVSPQDRKLQSIRVKISYYKNSVFPCVAGLFHESKTLTDTELLHSHHPDFILHTSSTDLPFNMHPTNETYLVLAENMGFKLVDRFELSVREQLGTLLRSEMANREWGFGWKASEKSTRKARTHSPNILYKQRKEKHL